MCYIDDIIATKFLIPELCGFTESVHKQTKESHASLHGMEKQTKRISNEQRSPKNTEGELEQHVLRSFFQKKASEFISSPLVRKG